MAIGLEDLIARLGAGIESTPGVCGGEPRIAGTRIPVWTLEQGRRLGASEAELLRDYPGLRAADLVNAWTYVATHGGEIEAQIRENEEAVSLSGTGPSKARPASIVKTPGVCGGTARVDGTRIPVWQLVEERDLGASEAQLLNSYRTLTARDLVAAWDYAEAHSEEIVSEIRRNAMVS
jgi:uncharacterized protein (DUF433 family)